MPELIDKQAVRLLESDADAYTENWNDDYEKGFCDAINKALELPTIEAEPVRHGRWIFVSEETMHDGWTYRKHKCTECDYVTVEAKNFCQNCGAQMDLRTPTEAQIDEADSVMMGGADNDSE